MARSLLALLLPALTLGACAGSTASPKSTSAAETIAVESTPPSKSTPSAESVEPDTQYQSKGDKRIAIIDGFLAAPITSATAPIILMLEGADATVELNNEVVPVLGLRTKKAGGILLTAFIAGNMRHQLISETNADASLSGVRAMLMVYATLKAEGELDPVPELEKMQQRELDGSLEQFINAN